MSVMPLFVGLRLQQVAVAREEGRVAEVSAEISLNLFWTSMAQESGAVPDTRLATLVEMVQTAFPPNKS